MPKKQPENILENVDNILENEQADLNPDGRNAIRPNQEEPEPENILENVDNILEDEQADLNPDGRNAISPNQEEKSAEQWIQDFRANDAFEKVNERGGVSYDFNQLPKIMAARMLADARRGDKSNLKDTNLKLEEINAQADKLKKDPTYQKFIVSIRKNAGAVRMTAAAVKSGNGGGLDDMLKDYIRTLPAGQLPQNPLMKRYMPTVKERIEGLRERVKAKKEPNVTKAAAEILALRNFAYAERGRKKSLDKAIPSNPKTRKDMREDIDALSNDEHFKRNIKENEKLIQRGHGGALANELLKSDREYYDAYGEHEYGERAQTALLRNAQTKSAEKWLEDFRKNGVFKRRAPDGSLKYDIAQVANVMAVRMLTNAEGSGKSKLQGKYLTAAEIQAKAAELKQDPVYQAFAAKLKSDPKTAKETIAAIKSGSGGGLDKIFKDHVKTLPAGELSNSPLLSRYMPTVKERIEILQGRAKKNQDPRDRTAAEIIVLRNLAGADRGHKKSLDQTIPTRYYNIKQDIDVLSNDKTFQALTTSKKNRIGDLALKGHGGALAERIRKYDKKEFKNTQRHPLPALTRKILNRNTVGERFKQLRREAAKLQKQIKAKGPKGDTAAEMSRAREIFGEYLALDSMTRDSKTKRFMTKKLNQDVPWDKLAKRTDKVINDPVFNRLADKMGENMLDSVVNIRNHEDFIAKITKEKAKIEEPEIVQPRRSSVMERQSVKSQVSSA